MAETKKRRPRSLKSRTVRLKTEYGSLHITVTFDAEGQPFEVFGQFGKGGSFERGVTELACRLISLHMRRGTPIDEIIEQCRGIQEMQPFVNELQGGTAMVRGLGDGIASVLERYCKTEV